MHKQDFQLEPNQRIRTKKLSLTFDDLYLIDNLIVPTQIESFKIECYIEKSDELPVLCKLKNLKKFAIDFHLHTPNWNLLNALRLVKNLPNNYILEKFRCNDSVSEISVERDGGQPQKLFLSDMILAWDPTKAKLTKVWKYN